MPLLSEALGRIQPSPTVGITQTANEMRRQGRDVIALSAGEPDFDTPDHIKKAAYDAIAAGKTKYTAVNGIHELREAIAAKFERDNSLKVKPEECFVGSGGKQIIFNAMMATLDPGDEVVIVAPYWVSYPDIVQLCGATPVIVHAGAETGFRPTPEMLADAITDRTKWLILNSPSNPSGAAMSADDLKAIAGVVRRHENLQVLTDDIYEQLMYDGRKFATLAQVAPDLEDRVLTMNGVSKSHSMTGWRIGYCTGPAEILKAMAKLQSQSTSNASSISQWAAVEALNGPMDFLDDWRAAFKDRRDLVVGRLNDIEGLDCLTPEGAFYVFPSCKEVLGRTTATGRTLETDEDFVMALLEEAGVALVHGSAFGLEGHFRVSYAAGTDQLNGALDRIGEFCKSLRD